MILAKISSGAWKAASLLNKLSPKTKFSKSIRFRESWRSHSRFGTPTNRNDVIHFHGASVGELEDILQIFSEKELLKKYKLSHSQFLLTASSISAKELLAKLTKQYDFSYCGPLPPEDSKELDSFFKIYNPKLFILSQNDLWPTYLNTLKKNSGKLLWMPRSITEIKSHSLKWLHEVLIGILQKENKNKETRHSRYPIFAIGDLRVQRILHRIKHNNKKHVPDNKIKIIIASAWLEDIIFMQKTLGKLSDEAKKKIKLCVVPHEINNKTRSWQKLLPEASWIYQQGQLLEMYAQQDLAFVGGGFKSGLHNILEPALYGLPIICGPKLNKQSSAQSLKDSQQLRVLSHPTQLTKIIENSVNKPNELSRWKEKSQTHAKQLEKSSSGACERLINLINKVINAKISS